MYDGGGEVSESVHLTNADFRKLLMTPRVAPTEEPSSTAADTVRGDDAKIPQTPQLSNKQRSEQRKNRKKQYAKLKREEDDKLAELAQKYRDRAQERREGNNQDDAEESMRNATSAYRAVAPDFKSGMDAAERKRKMIQESKYLGGDMEHTHLVKGLDFALLQKVRSEIEEKELEQELEMDRLVKAKAKEKIVENEKAAVKKKVIFRTAMARNLCETVMLMKSKVVKINELFAPGRMAYVVELDDEFDTTEIPTTLIRSKADVPVIDSTSTLSTNDIVINKLTQILSYLRQGVKPSKKGKKSKDARLSPDRFGNSNLPKTMATDNIYDDIGDYVPTITKTESSQSTFGAKTAPYFVKPDGEIRETDNNKPCMPNISNLAAIVDAKTETNNQGLGLLSAADSYSECYPGLVEMNDALYDSDEEVDYTKMDSGSKKGILNRWDFDTTDEYSDYMSKREAMPKAAYQYGVKMEDGRRTQRANNKPKNDKTKFDKQWQQIQNIMCKRKNNSTVEGSKFKVPKND